ncbi:hypothetical protein [Yoonia sp. SS1-5]|uniref:Uncharacterized protein n=1 Tax=Yoonia rhodophyticola TaxID=3137370 RepID=A0AAN0NM19_9RHOB
MMMQQANTTTDSEQPNPPLFPLSPDIIRQLRATDERNGTAEIMSSNDK